VKRSQTALILAKIAMGDNRRLDPDDAVETPILDYWHEQIGDLDVRDCLAAVAEHRRSSGEYLMPVHVRDGVKRVRGARLAVVSDLGVIMGDVDGDTPGPEWLATLKARRAAIAAGAPLVEAIAACPAPKAITAGGGR
jgi:hypothetical protein